MELDRDVATTATAPATGSVACPIRACRHLVYVTEYPNTARLPTCVGRCEHGRAMEDRKAGRTCRGASAFWRRLARSRGYFAGATSADLAGSDRDVTAWRQDRADW